MYFLNLLVLALYAVGLIVIFLYTLAQLNLLYYYLKGRQVPVEDSRLSHKKPEEYPMITVQLPVYNERYVIERLIDTGTQLKWPKERWEIQVLDDSTDETVEAAAKKIQEYQNKGYKIKHVRRRNREGYKAGALQCGLQKAEGEFIAIFDADFMPKPDFLIKAVSAFENDNIGMVQTRWEHLNKNYSLLTRMQAFALDAHFSIEQKGRNSAGCFMSFNGTAGIWRKSCIEDAGGWQHDTLTEDLDLSYRAQMKGWKFKYLEQVGSPAELPVTISALKTQQFRWMKGGAESARKHLKHVWDSAISSKMKLHASSHLLSSSIFIFILLIAVLSVPLLWIKSTAPELSGFFTFAGFFILGLLGWVLFYAVSFNNSKGRGAKKAIRFILLFPLFLSISMGLSLHLTVAAVKGFTRKPSPFMRTPKFNITGTGGSWGNNKYAINKLNMVFLLEGFLTFYFIGGLIMAFILSNFAFLPFHLMLAFGFGTVFWYSLHEKMLSPA